MVGPRNRVYYTGDTSYMPEMVEVGRRFGPFDLVLTDSGQYNTGWPDVHLGPEQAIELAAAVGAKAMVPIHWGLIRLARHSGRIPSSERLQRPHAAASEFLFLLPGGLRTGDESEPQEMVAAGDMAVRQADADPIEPKWRWVKRV